MPIRQLEKELAKRHLIKKFDLDTLKENTIGIDGAWFVRKYSLFLQGKNILMDGFGKEILSHVESLLECMEKVGCRVVWIWNGISPTLELRKVPEKRRKELVVSGCEHYSNGEIDLASKAWAVAFDYEEQKASINAVLARYKVEVVNAPYFATAQGAYMEKKLYISMFFGATDYLLFPGAEDLILDFEFITSGDRKTMTVASCTVSEICKSLNLTLNSMREIFLMLGSEYCPTIPAHSLVFDPFFIIETYRNKHVSKELQRKVETASQDGRVDKFTVFANTYFKAQYVINHQPVMNENGELVLLTECGFSPTLELVFGKRIPDCFFSLFFRGVISLEYITGLVMGRLDVICAPTICEAIEPVLFSLYRATSLVISGLQPTSNNNSVCIGGAERLAEAIGGREKAPMEELIKPSLKQTNELPLVLQWLIVLLDRADPSMLDKIFIFNPVHHEIESPDEIDWEVFEVGESFKFAISSIKNKLKLDKPEREIDPVSISCINGWRMEEILVLCRKKRMRMLSPGQISLIERNLEYIEKLQRFFSDNVKSNRHKNELDILVKYAKEKLLHA
ncbi:hypothetical protein NERG_02557 [Nematocida ausubeli]|uniref:XPG-I domain-containing protein n=1 Tax=Nematocida ausubeli (strain ATCC PRA-371 / ERTm2) TaxID=1913371 RepID=H8ZG36_NEMA1|nr:hypothetical protein NERG_02557 [Nematocida ausubeli]